VAGMRLMGLLRGTCEFRPIASFGLESGILNAATVSEVKGPMST
jgi:hypothetical protein